jgi:hypothetical protein
MSPATPNHPRPPRVTSCHLSFCEILFVLSQHQGKGWVKSGQVQDSIAASPAQNLGPLASAAGLHREKLQTTLARLDQSCVGNRA